MLFIRASLFFLGLVFALSITILVALFTFYLPLENRYKVLSMWAKFNIWWLDVTCNLKFKVIGGENIPKKACVIISNHQSTWETFAFQKIFPHQTWVLKKELLWIPIFGWGLAMLKPIIIDRGDKIKSLRKVIRQGAKKLKKNIFVIIFPEGTRQAYGKIGLYQSGGVAIAKHSNTDLLPVYHNAGKFWAKGSFIKLPGVITVVIGKSVSTQEKPASELTKQLQNWTKQQAEKYQ